MTRAEPGERTRGKRALWFLGLLVLLAGVTAWGVREWQSLHEDAEGDSSGGGSDSTRLRVAFVLGGSPLDLAYNFRVDQGRVALEAFLGGELRVSRRIVASRQDVEPVLEELCARGTDVLFSTLSEHAAMTERVAERYPQTSFIQFYGGRTLPNLSTCRLRDWEPAYVCGRTAALAAPGRTRFGFVGPETAPPTRWIVNAFALGARSVDPEITVDLVYAGDWLPPDGGRAAVETLARRGVSTVYFLVFRPVEGMRLAADSGMSVLYHFTDLSHFSPRNWITGTVWQWFPLYERVVNEVSSGTWTSRDWTGGFKEGVLTLAPFGPAVPQEARASAVDAVRRIVSEELAVFVGPLVDGEGRERVPAGKVLSPGEVFSQDWLVEGVVVTEDTGR